MTDNIRVETDWACAVDLQIKGMDRLRLLRLGLTCLERVINVWREFAPRKSKIFAALNTIRNFRLEDLKSVELVRWKQVVLECKELAATAELQWNGEATDGVGLAAFRANMAAASLSNLFYVVLQDENLELATGFCLGLAWAASNYEPAERQFQQTLIDAALHEKPGTTP